MVERRSVGVIGVGASIALVIIFRISRYWLTASWLKSKRHRYQTALLESLEKMKECCSNEGSATGTSILDPATLDYQELKLKLVNGELSCDMALKSFQKRALQENELYNFIAQPIAEALEVAKELDSVPKEEIKELPLYGIPISLKENFQILGYDCTMGCSVKIGDAMTSSCPIYKALLKAGAIPFLRANLAQTMKSLGAHNPIYGQTRNPLDRTRSPGGSSCGDAAAVASGSSVIGIGTDVGGSVRVPAIWCGICALKPTVGRLSSYRMSSITKGQTALMGVTGVMARSVDGIADVLRSMSTQLQYDYDLALPPLHFNEQEYQSTRSLRVAYYLDWTSIPTTESAKKMVLSAVSELAEQGHTVFEWEIPQVDVLNPAKLLLVSMFTDGGSQIKELLYGDEISYVISPLIKMLRQPAFLKRWLGKLLWRIYPSWWTFKNFVGPAGLQSVDEWFRHCHDVERYRRAWLDDWQKKNIDVLITPVTPIPAEKIDETGCASGCGTFTFLMNLVDFPAGVVPCGKITREEELYDFNMYPDRTSNLRKLRQAIPGSAGLPLGVQVVARPFKEEVCLRVMNTLAKMDTYN